MASTTPHIQNQVIQLSSGVDIACRWYIPATQEATHDIVLLHEALGCIEMWRDFPRKLAERTGCRVFVYDREGYGKSSPLRQIRKPDYLHKYAHEECAELLEKAGINSPILFGHSDGGSIALLYASKFRPKAVISEAGHVFVEDITVRGIASAKYVWAQSDLETRLAKYHGTKTAEIFDAWAEVWLSYDFMRWNMEEDLKTITCPTLIIQGADDEYGSDKQVESIMTNCQGPTKSYMIPDCKHIPHLQQQAIVLQQTADFIETLR